MRILDTPVRDCLEQLNGKPYRIGDFAIWKHSQGFECIAERLQGGAFIMPPNTTLIDARRFVTIFNAGFNAGVNCDQSEAAFAETPGAERRETV